MAVTKKNGDRLGDLQTNTGSREGVAAEFLWDVSKAVDSAQREKLAGLAKHFNYPLAVRRQALNANSWELRIMLDSMVSGPIWAHRGIGPGSTTATFENC